MMKSNGYNKKVRKHNNPSGDGTVRTKKKGSTTHLDNNHAEAERFSKGIPSSLNPSKTNTSK